MTTVLLILALAYIFRRALIWIGLRIAAFAVGFLIGYRRVRW